MNRERFSLAELVDWLALDGPRDVSLVLRTIDWLEERRDHIDVEGVTSAAWQDAVLTLQVDGQVSAVLTGHRADLPGEWTWKVREADFPGLMMRWREHVAEPVSFCALDLSVRGQTVLLPTGDRAIAQAAVMVGRQWLLRVRCGDGQVRSVPRHDVVTLGDGETPPS
jgi:hypothetical protein